MKLLAKEEKNLRKCRKESPDLAVMIVGSPSCFQSIES
jgi:hypothetical protein